MLKNEMQSYLDASNLSKYLDPEEIEMLLARNKMVTFPAGDTILKQGHAPDGIYIIIEGNVTATAKLLGEGTTNLESLGPGNFFGEISFIGKVPSATTILASTQVKCLFLEKTYFELLSSYFPETQYKIFNAISKQVCARLKKMHNKITTFIAAAEMSTTSFFGDIIQSMTKPTEITFDQGHIDINKLQHSPSFNLFTQNDIEELFKHGVLLKVPKHCTLIDKGDKNPSCYLVIHGAVQSSIIHDNKNAKLSVIGPDTLFSSMACIDNSDSFTITFVTCEQAILFKLSDSDLSFLKTNNPMLWYKIFDLICKSLIMLEKSVDKLDIRLNIETYNR